jgi:AcrR family transcriptional regulator
VARAAAKPVAANEELDGRRRRSRDSRARIVEALLALVHAGDLTPPAEEVAARAGVGLRSVFRHFSDMESLYREMTVLIEAELFAVVQEPLKGQTWRERLSEMLQRRALVYEKIGPFKRAADAQRRKSPHLQASHARLVAGSRQLIKRELPAEITRDRLRFEALDLLMSYETWNRLRREQELSIKRAGEVVAFAVEKLLA